MFRKTAGFALAAAFYANAAAGEPFVLLAPDAPPYYTQTEDGVLVGRGVEWFRRVAELADIEWSASLEPFNRAVARLAKGDADIAVIPTGPQIEALELLRIDEPVRYVRVDAYWRVGREPVRVADDLIGRRVGVMAPMSYGGLLVELDLQPHVATANALGLLRAIERGRIDTILLYRETFAYAVSALGGVAVDLARTQLRAVPIRVYARADAPGGGAALLERIERVMPLVEPSVRALSD